MLTYTVTGGKWPGVFERLDVGPNGDAVYEVLSGPRVVGSGSGETVGTFRAPADQQLSDELKRNVQAILPAPSTKGAAPGSVLHTLAQDGHEIASWSEGDNWPIAAVLRTIVTKAESRPVRTLNLSLATGGLGLVFTVNDAPPVVLSFDDAELNADLVFTDGKHQVLEANATAELLGVRTPMEVSAERPLSLRLLLPPADSARLERVMLVVRANFDSNWWVSPIARRRVASSGLNYDDHIYESSKG